MRRCAGAIAIWLGGHALVGCGHGTPAAAATPAMALVIAPSHSPVPTPSPMPSPTPSATPTPLSYFGVLPLMAADRGTPPAYPEADARAYREAVLTAQEAATIAPTMTPAAKAVVNDLTKLGVQRIDIWYGSHLELAGDKGKFYARWTAPAGAATRRTSSHESSAPQYQLSVGFRDIGILMGKTTAGDTWLQFERHAFHGQGDSGLSKIVGIVTNIGSAHGEDYLIYRRTHQNVGPLGLSPHTDTNPLVIAVP